MVYIIFTSEKKMDECDHMTQMPLLSTRVNKGINLEWKSSREKKLKLAFILWSLTFCINFKWFP